MTSQQIFQLFQTLWDQIDSQLYPEIYPEQVFEFINLEVDRWCLEARKAFETSTELTDYMRELVVDVFTENKEVGSSSEALYSLSDFHDAETGALIPCRYLIAAKQTSCTLSDGRTGLCQLKEQTHNERSARLRNPFAKPTPSECYYVVTGKYIVVDTHPSFQLGRSRWTIIRNPATISATTQPDISPSWHRLLVEKAVQNTKASLQPVQQ